MKVLARVLAVLSCVVLSAHFLRRAAGGGNPLLWLPVLACLALPFLLLMRAAWGTVVVRLVLALGIVVWISSALEIRRQRIEEGRRYTAAMVILGSVAAVSALAALILRPREAADAPTGTGSAGS